MHGTMHPEDGEGDGGGPLGVQVLRGGREFRRWIGRQRERETEKGKEGRRTNGEGAREKEGPSEAANGADGFTLV